MGQLDNRPENSETPDRQDMDRLVSAMTQEIREIQHNLLVQLTQDMARLEAEKNRLRSEIDQLQGQQQRLQSQQYQAVGRQQIVQQQQWTKHLAQVMASQLQEELSDRLKHLAASPTPQPLPGTASTASTHAPSPPPSSYNDNAYRLLASLDTTLNTTFKTLQQELSSYQSSLSQQLNRMHSLQQQGEAVLETLVERLIAQLQEDAGQVHTTAEIISQGQRAIPGESAPSTGERPEGDRPSPAQTAQRATDRPAPQPAPPPAPSADGGKFLTGIILISISSLVISIQNIVTRVILSLQPVIFFGEMGGIIGPGPGNSLLILAMRMLLVVPGMAIVGSILYPNTFRDLRQLSNPEKRGSVWIPVLSGVCLFLSQFFIYFALGNIATGVAIAIFFVFPTVTILLSWLIFGSRPSFILALAAATIYIGCFLTLPPIAFQGGGSNNILLGASTALASGVTFAGYVILTQLSAKKLKLHPAPFSVLNFSVILVFSVVFLRLFPAQTDGVNWFHLWFGTVLLALTTLVGYALNNFGIPMIGAAFASVISASGPALTSLLAVAIISESLALNQWLGVIIVTLWVIGISVDNLTRQKQARMAAANQNSRN
jgi:drug/metabolite transporter (DMT)-like permease